uniref:Lengsin n=1 Tax=Pogona vitticeps TaxID=103695 RepID=A0A6J0SM64_9SAUR
MFVGDKSINAGCNFLIVTILDESLNQNVQEMDKDDSACQSTAENENEEVDGNPVCGLRRRRRIKVTGREGLAAGCNPMDASHSANTSDQGKLKESLPNLSAMQEKEDNLAEDCCTKEGPQEGREKPCENSPEAQRLRTDLEDKEEPVKNRENSRMSMNVAEEPGATEAQKKAKGYPLATQEKEDSKDSLTSRPGISKETLQELKNLLRVSPLLSTRARKSRKPSSGSSHTSPLLPSDKPGLFVETSHPHLRGGGHEVLSGHPNGTKQVGRPPLLHSSAVPDEQNEEVGELPERQQTPSPPEGDNAPGTKYDLMPEEQNREPDVKKPSSHIPLYLACEIDHIKEQMARDNIHFVRFEATDLHGVSRSKTIPSRFFRTKAIHGVSMPRGYLELTLNPRDSEINQISASNFNCDIVLCPDFPTFRTLPWTEQTARLICDSFTVTGKPLLTSPRYIAKQQLHHLHENGFALSSAFTYEFCIYGIAEIVNSKTISFPAATLLNNHEQSFIQELIDGMYHAGANIESFSSSTGPGQMEVSFHPEFGIGAADNAFTFRTGIKEVAKKYNYIASFFTENGFCNAGIFSHSLWNSSGQENLFSGGAGASEFTDVGKHWLSGLLVHSPALSCLMAPTLSCRKRYSTYSKSSKDTVIAKWACNDNSCAFNLKGHGEKGPRIENKLGSAAANPYLVLSATIAAGLDGIKRGLCFPEAMEEIQGSGHFKAATVPLKLEDALLALQEDECIREAFGDNFVQYFVAMKQYEIETEEMDIERNKFLEYFI